MAFNRMVFEITMHELGRGGVVFILRLLDCFSIQYVLEISC